ncbi:MAG TPA: hypothetical protein DIW52_15425, partial [Pseudomonas sp.]|nr:hypothetical protein [Pseudomonas sp.]
MPPTDPLDQQRQNTQRTVLLATDSQNSMLAEMVGNATNHLTYSAYGHQSARQEVATRLGFNGELREAQTCWYLLGNGYRAYNPRLMRFHSPDSWSPFGRGGLNPYMYCMGDPVNRSDPTGHWPPFKAVGSFLKTLGPGKSRPVDLNKLDLSGATEMIGQAENARITYVAPPARSSGIGDILYAVGTAHPMPGGSPRITSVIETARHYPGYVQGAAMGGLTYRSRPSTPQSSSLNSRPRQNSFDAPRTLHNGASPRDPVLVHERLLGGAPHSGPPQAPPPPPPLLNQAALDNWSSSSSSSSTSSSASSSP